MDKVKTFFWFCSGANISILKRCPTESSKYTGIGATVFFTGLLAAISSGYALFTVFNSIAIASLFGVVWGLMIFNLDRFIVSSMKKRNNFWNEFRIATPRLILAILLAIVISKPLELKIFDKEINNKIDQQKTALATNAKISISKSYPEILAIENKISILKSEIKSKEDFVSKKQKKYDDERFGVKTAETTGIPSIGVNALKAEKQLDESQKDLEKTKADNAIKINGYEKQLALLDSVKNISYLIQKPNIDNYDGLAARISALSALSSESSAMNLANIFLILLFIVIETSPIFVKIISSKGPYDNLLEQHEHIIENYKLEEMAKLNQTTYEKIQVLIACGENNIEDNIEVNKSIKKIIGIAVLEIAEEKIAKWKDDELNKLKNAS